MRRRKLPQYIEKIPLLTKSNQRVYFSLSGIRLISDLLFSQWEDQNEADSRVISWNEFYYAGAAGDVPIIVCCSGIYTDEE